MDLKEGDMQDPKMAWESHGSGKYLDFYEK